MLWNSASVIRTGTGHCRTRCEPELHGQPWNAPRRFPGSPETIRGELQLDRWLAMGIREESLARLLTARKDEGSIVTARVMKLNRPVEVCVLLVCERDGPEHVAVGPEVPTGVLAASGLDLEVVVLDVAVRKHPNAVAVDV